MKKALQELESNTAQIILLLRKNEKIMSRHKVWLCEILTMIINSQKLNEDDLKVFRIFKKLDRDNQMKSPVFDRLNHEYVALSDWLIENQGLILPKADKERIISIMANVNSFPEYSGEEIDQLI
jgi:hypothetical protein